jgi:hypothetical protein
VNPEDLLRKRLGEGRYRQVERAIKNQKLLDTAPRAAQYQGFQINNGAIVRTVGDGVRAVAPVSNGLVVPGESRVRVVGSGATWKPGFEAPVEEEVKEEKYYPFKVLFSVKEPDPNDKTKEVLAFYLGGDRKAPKRLFHVDSSVSFEGYLHNYGQDYKASINYIDVDGKPVIVNCNKKEIVYFKSSELENILSFRKFYLGDCRWQSINISAPWDASGSVSGEFCNVTYITNWYLKNDYPSYPFAVEGTDTRTTRTYGENNGSCIIDISTRTANLLYKNINWFIDNTNKPIVVNFFENHQSLNGLIAQEFSGNTINLDFDLTTDGKNGKGYQYFQPYFEYSQKFQERGNANLINYLDEAIIKYSSILIYGYKKFINQELELSGKVVWDNNIRVYQGTRTNYINKLYLQSYDSQNALEINQNNKFLTIDSDVDIDLNMDSTTIRLIRNSINNVSGNGDINGMLFSSSENLANFVNSYLNSPALIAYNKDGSGYFAEGRISNIDFNIEEIYDNNDGYSYYLNGMFAVTIELNKVKKSKYLPFASDKGRLVTNYKYLKNLLYFVLPYGTSSHSSCLFYNAQTINIFYSYFSLTSDDRMYKFYSGSPFWYGNSSYFGNLINELTINYESIFEYLAGIGNFIDNKIFIVNFRNQNITKFDDIKTKEKTKYAEVISIKEDGYADIGVESGTCLSLNSPNCTIHAVSYCPKPNP